MSDKKTPLNATHRKAGARMVSFAGWDMPVQYAGVIQEHKAVREKAGLFDVSHMGEIWVTGPNAAAVCQHLITNDVGLLQEDGQIIYSAVCQPDGGTVDDVLLHRISPTEYLFVVNAANIDKDFAFFCEHAPQGAELTNRSDDWGQLALQGPLSQQILQPLVDVALDDIAYYTFKPATMAGIRGLLARTGYTGEDGFELYVPADRVVELWNKVMEAGAPQGLEPIGLGARDTLRLEAGYSLYGHELSATITPLEANLGWVTKLDGDDFVGRDALRKQKEAGIPRQIVGFRFTGRGVPRDGYPVWKGDEQLGVVTSGTMSPMLQTGIGLALVKRGSLQDGDALDVEIRGKRFPAVVQRPPFVPSNVRRKPRKA